MRLPRPAAARLIALLLPLALLAGAFGSQYLGGLTPCEMCWWQRYPHIAARGCWPRSRLPLRRTLRALAHADAARSAAIAVSGAIGVYHAGVELKIFEGFTTCTATASGANAELLKQIIAAPLVRCDEVQWSFLGISMAGWNAILSLGGAAVIAFLTLRGSRR